MAPPAVLLLLLLLPRHHAVARDQAGRAEMVEVQPAGRELGLRGGLEQGAWYLTMVAALAMLVPVLYLAPPGGRQLGQMPQEQ
jgi:hypothetical protein